ncbi:signal transduction histidine kinase [Flavobacterium limnosediminis JC2902]|uniref:histidine kinase n=1 Tax=Flavobacterium limnosediminis JC2902 TaxID=1341181 RepID=V6SL96_9FLAO|nr:response regulator [Flavobacterium limnosediminis]ESU27381.1 signal transduction histidine kinase [Flavobacterium limnosediminis JC2902]
MNTNKPSYEELATQVAVLKEQVINLSSMLSETYRGYGLVTDSLENEKLLEKKALNAALIESVLRKIKMPLDTIAGLAGLLSASKSEFKEKDNFAEIIVNCSNELQGIVSEFLNYNSLELQKEVVELQKVSLNELLDDLKIKFGVQASYKELNFRTKKGLPDGEDTVMIDENKITQVFTSLINNSLKFTDKGFIEVGYRLADNELKFYVKDTGAGLDKNLVEKLSASKFELEKYVDETSNVGLGFATVKRYVDLLGGALKVDSELGVGTVVYFDVPYVPAPVDVEPVSVKKTIKVLVAEDEEISFLLLKSLLEKGNVQIFRAKNGEEAYEIYKNNPDINLILMDLRMPQVDGYTAAQLIKNEAPEIPIIAQSAYLLEDEKGVYGQAFNDFLSKPVNKKEFQQAVNKYVDVSFLN